MKDKTRLAKTGIVLGVCLAVIGGTAVFSEPGGTDDPVVTKSYIVDKVIPDIMAYIDQRFGTAASEGMVTGRPDAFAVVSVSAGKRVICEAGTELILRMGQGTLIATEKGGLADTTMGYDLPDGYPMPSNHLLVVPVADGRGFRADTDVMALIKGGYMVE